MYDNPAEILVYHCRNLRLFENGSHKSFSHAHAGVRLVAIPCSGKVEAHHLLKSLAGGVQGVLVLACAQQACRFMEGSSRSAKRVEYARLWLTKLDIEPERIEFRRIPPMDVGALEEALSEFSERVRSFGPVTTAREPFKKSKTL
ncbi:MAG: hydrogenase iron-sulfur subunit [Thermodesulfobacteriota bacterium]